MHGQTAFDPFLEILIVPITVKIVNSHFFLRVMGDVAAIPLFFDRIYRILRIFCFHFHFPDENENTKSLREGRLHNSPTQVRLFYLPKAMALSSFRPEKEKTSGQSCRSCPMVFLLFFVIFVTFCKK